MSTERVSDNSVFNPKDEEVVVIRPSEKYLPDFGKDIIYDSLVFCYCEAGMFRALYDMHEVEFWPHEVAVIMPNHVLRPLSCTDDYAVTRVVVEEEFLEEMKRRTLNHDYAKYHTKPTCLLTETQSIELKKIIDAIEVIAKMDSETLPHRHDMLAYLVDVLFEVLNVYRRAQDVSYSESRPMTVFNQFCDLLAQHYKEHHDAAFYASKLHISTQHFSKLIEQAIGISASAWIRQYIITQAKQILATRPDMNVQQVAYSLGFSESAGFCRFFKNATGFRPKDFRANQPTVSSSSNESIPS